jgi:hypothetical protein
MCKVLVISTIITIPINISLPNKVMIIL